MTRSYGFVFRFAGVLVLAGSVVAQSRPANEVWYYFDKSKNVTFDAFPADCPQTECEPPIDTTTVGEITHKVWAPRMRDWTDQTISGKTHHYHDYEDANGGKVRDPMKSPDYVHAFYAAALADGYPNIVDSKYAVYHHLWNAHERDTCPEFSGSCWDNAPVGKVIRETDPRAGDPIMPDPARNGAGSIHVGLRFPVSGEQPIEPPKPFDWALWIAIIAALLAIAALVIKKNK